MLDRAACGGGRIALVQVEAVERELCMQAASRVASDFVRMDAPMIARLDGVAANEASRDRAALGTRLPSMRPVARPRSAATARRMPTTWLQNFIRRSRQVRTNSIRQPARLDDQGTTLRAGFRTTSWNR